MSFIIKAKEVHKYKWSDAFEIPVLELVKVDENNNEVSRGYLSPFRGYCFQVSYSIDGDCDCGSCPVVGLANIKINNWGKGTTTAAVSSNCHSTDEVTKCILRALMVDAISSYMENGKGITIGLQELKRSQLFKEYTDKVYEYLWPEEVKEEE